MFVVWDGVVWCGTYNVQLGNGVERRDYHVTRHVFVRLEVGNVDGCVYLGMHYSFTFLLSSGSFFLSFFWVIGLLTHLLSKL